VTQLAGPTSGDPCRRTRLVGLHSSDPARGTSVGGTTPRNLLGVSTSVDLRGTPCGPRCGSPAGRLLWGRHWGTCVGAPIWRKPVGKPRWGNTVGERLLGPPRSVPPLGGPHFGITCGIPVGRQSLAHPLADQTLRDTLCVPHLNDPTWAPLWRTSL
jgi:hypothetical protein